MNPSPETKLAQIFCQSLAWAVVGAVGIVIAIVYPGWWADLGATVLVVTSIIQTHRLRRRAQWYERLLNASDASPTERSR